VFARGYEVIRGGYRMFRGLYRVIRRVHGDTGRRSNVSAKYVVLVPSCPHFPKCEVGRH